MSAETAEAFFDHAIRFDSPQNSVGLTGIDHVGLPARDPLEAGKFYEQVLGAVEIQRAGYSQRDIELGRPKHVFYRLGGSVVQVGQQVTGDGYPAAETANPNPHTAFGTTAEGLFRLMAHLEGQGVPFDGPRRHFNMSAVSVYFRDAEGNNLEATTWENIAEEKTKPMGGPAGFVMWAALAHNWTPRPPLPQAN